MAIGKRGDRARNRRPQRSREGQDVVGGILSGFIPGVGEAMDIRDAVDALTEGDFKGAAGIAGTGLLGLVPIVGDSAATAARTARRAGKAQDIVQGGRRVGRRSTDPDTGVVSETYDDLADSGWNYKGKSRDEHRRDMERDHASRTGDVGLTDKERSLKEQGLLGRYKEWEGVASPRDIEVAEALAAILKDPAKGNYPQEQLIKEYLDSIDHKDLTAGGVAHVLGDILGKTPEEMLRLIASAK